MTTESPKPTNEAQAGQSLAASALFGALLRVLKQVDECEESNNVAVLYGTDRRLLDLLLQPCKSCDPSFGCWGGSEPCRKVRLSPNDWS